MNTQWIDQLLKYFYITFFLFLFIVSCGEEKITHPIEGDWMEVIESKVILKDPFYSNNEYARKLSFYSDTTMERAGGFHKRIGGDFPSAFLGNRTAFKIEKDKLFYFDLSENKWIKQRVVKLDSEFLILESGKFIKTKYKKLYKDKNPNPKFQKIIFSQSGCYGACPILDIIINADGSIIFYGERYTHRQGLYTAKITKTQYEEILNGFKYVDIKTVKDDYSVNHTDDETYNTTVIVKNKVYKSIHDYGIVAPSEFQWGLFLISDLYQNLDLKQRSLSDFPVYLNLKGFSFQRGDTRYQLTKSESFYLWDSLRKGKVSNKNFTYRYNLEFDRQGYWRNSLGNVDSSVSEEDLKRIFKIETDGRFYKFYFTNKEPITQDIGFDFLQDIPIDKLFESKDYFSEDHHIRKW